MFFHVLSKLFFILPYNISAEDESRKITEYDAVEFKRLFEKQGLENLRLLFALRISASFPFFSPMVEIPSNPRISLIDVGVRDDLGFDITLRFMNRYSEWIKNNTSGAIIVQIKADRPSTIEIESDKYNLKNAFIEPITGVMNSFSTIQIYNQNQLKEYTFSNLDFDVDMVAFNLFKKEKGVSLSWHLTSIEKKQILNAKNLKSNKTAFSKFYNLLGLKE